MALRGSTEVFGSPDNGNFLSSLEYLAEYGLFIAAHIKKYGNCGGGAASYLSSTTYEEFIALMAGKL